MTFQSSPRIPSIPGKTSLRFEPTHSLQVLASVSRTRTRTSQSCHTQSCSRALAALVGLRRFLWEVLRFLFWGFSRSLLGMSLSPQTSLTRPTDITSQALHTTSYPWPGSFGDFTIEILRVHSPPTSPIKETGLHPSSNTLWRLASAIWCRMAWVHGRVPAGGYQSRPGAGPKKRSQAVGTSQTPLPPHLPTTAVPGVDTPTSGSSSSTSGTGAALLAATAPSASGTGTAGVDCLTPTHEVTIERAEGSQLSAVAGYLQRHEDGNV